MDKYKSTEKFEAFLDAYDVLKVLRLKMAALQALGQSEQPVYVTTEAEVRICTEHAARAFADAVYAALKR
jgi:hypothetical protein